MSRGIKGLTAILAILAVAALLIITWRLGDPPPAPQTEAPSTQSQTTAAPATTAAQTTTLPQATEAQAATTASPSATAPPSTAPPQATAPATEAATQAPPAEGDSAEDGALTCTLVIRCDTLLANLDSLAEEKRGLVPESGILLEVTATFFEGESVFNVLAREARRAELHVEYTNTPGYGSAYIEGIGNLYQYDCGPLSGWVYAVNDAFPAYGCSRYTLTDGDRVTLLYTCDLGADVGGNNGFEE